MTDKICKISTYIINLKKRTDRKAYINKQFKGRSEFDVHFFNAIEHNIPAVGLYQSIYAIVEEAQEKKLPFVLICEDDHTFTDNYDTELFMAYISRLQQYQTDLFLGGVSWFECGVRIERDLYWVNKFTGTQFMIICSSFYQRILKSPFENHNIIDRWMCRLTEHILVSVPMLSIQKDFGYSDVTIKNNTPGKVDKLFSVTADRWQALNDIYDHIRRSKSKYQLVDQQYEEMQLPTYVINLAHRPDRLKHIKQQFSDKKEFNVSVVEGCEEKDGALGLWNSIRKVVQLAIENDEDIILMCEDDHTFSSAYNKKHLFDTIYRGASLGADIILGGISNVRQTIAVNDHLCWIDKFQCTQFTIIYSSIFEAILETEFVEGDAADLKLSNMTVNKYVIHPFISTQKDFGYSDIPINNFDTAQYLKKFENCASKINQSRTILSDCRKIAVNNA